MKKLLLLLLLPFSVFAQTIPSPSDFLGHELGSEFPYHHELVSYFRTVAEASPVVTLMDYGSTTERRPLIYAVVTSPKNQQQLEQIRQAHLQRIGLGESAATSARDLPIVWLSHSVHGNETAGLLSSFKTLFELARTDNPQAQEWLENVIVILDPSENPDGYARYSHWYNRYKTDSPTAAPEALEHNEPWPGGRYNHYLFDMNRDWAWQTQRETQQRIAVYQSWMPHVHIDLHEMGVNSPYFNGWPAEPLHEHISPWQRNFQKAIGQANADAFDKEGWLYYTKEVFDLFYPSYGDTWPTFNGAIGLTFEQGGSGRGGVAVTTATGEALTLKDRLLHHHTAAMATIATAYQQREQLTTEFNSYFERSQQNPVGEYRSFIIDGTTDAAKLHDFLQLLERNKIRFGYANTTKKPLQAYNYSSRTTGNYSPKASDIVISSYQPQSVLLNVLMEPTSKLSDSLTYDLTAWALPYVYNLNAYASKTRMEPRELLTAGAVMPPAPALPASAYAYLLPWNNFSDAQFLAAALQNDFRVRFARAPFNAGGINYPAGSLMIAKGENAMANFDTKLQQLAKEHMVPLQAVNSGLATSGADFGSSGFGYVKAPKVALAIGEGTYPTATGELWHYFEQQLGYPILLLDAPALSERNLADVDVLLLPAGSYGETDKKVFESFTANGGKVIALEQAMRLFTNEGTALAAALEREKEDEKADAPDTEDLLRSYGTQEREELAYQSAGSMYKAYLDSTHPLAFGQGEEVYLMKRNSKAYPLLEGGWNVGHYKTDSHVGGFIGYKVKQSLENSLAFGSEPQGRGALVYFPDSPVFRAFWHSGKLLLANAVFFVEE